METFQRLSNLPIAAVAFYPYPNLTAMSYGAKHYFGWVPRQMQFPILQRLWRLRLTIFRPIADCLHGREVNSKGRPHCALIGHERNFDVLRKAIQILREDGQRNFANIIVTEETIEGWAVWQEKSPLEISISNGAHPEKGNLRARSSSSARRLRPRNELLHSTTEIGYPPGNRVINFWQSVPFHSSRWQ